MNHKLTFVAAMVLAGAGVYSYAQELPPEPIPVEGVAGLKTDNVTPPLPPMPVVADPHPSPVEPPLPPSLLRTPVPADPPLVYPWDPHDPPAPRASYVATDRLGVSPGWFAGFELAAVGLHLSNQLTGQVTINGFDPDIVQLPSAELDGAGVPRFELGYRLCEGMGAFVIVGRFLESDGRAIVSNWDILGDGFLRSRLNVVTLDFDYVSPEHALGEQWDLQWRIGARLANVYFDSRVEGMFVEQQASNSFEGAGPHATVDVRRHFGASGWAAFGRIDAATLLGSIHQTFAETVFFEDGSMLSGATSVRGTQGVPVLSLQAGLSWVPHGWPRSRYVIGYQFEQWWSLGRLGDSSADLTDQGLFLRAEYNY